jgi:1-acyl-sn-glycerol-3-phosphate acyltransferase
MSSLVRETWLAAWRTAQRYHRYTVEGFEHLEGPGAALVVGYHGSPVAWDMCMLMVRVYDRLGYFPHGVVQRSVEGVRLLKWVTDELGGVTRDGPEITAAVLRGEHIFTTPGGTAEACRGLRDRYRVDWGHHVGSLRLALRHRIPIVPVAAAGTNDAYIGLNDARALGKRLGFSRDWTWVTWLGVGPLGIFPFSPPFPVRMRQLIGAPIDVRALGARDGDEPSRARAQRHVTGVVQSLLDRARGIANEHQGGTSG